MSPELLYGAPAIYSGKTLATLGLTPGTYVWTLGSRGSEPELHA